MVPIEPSGLKIEKLDYKGESDDETNNLNDDDVKDLAEALKCNDEFSGPVDLSDNDLTNLVSYNLNFFHFVFFYYSHAFTCKKQSLDQDRKTSQN